MTGARDDDVHSGEQPDAAPKWHNSTPKLLAASAAGLAAIGLVVAGVTVLSRAAGEPPQPPANFVDSGTTARTQTTGSSEAATTTLTTRINPPETTDIDLPPSLPPPPPESTSGEPPSTTGDEAEDDDEGSEESTPRTTRNRPRLNETRTLYPRN